MKGVVLDFDEATSKGLISAENGMRYEFSGVSWRADHFPGSGVHVDFEVFNDKADNIYIDPCKAKSADKNRMAAAMLAFFFGFLGFHKFYLGNNKPATIMLCVSLGGLLLAGIPTLLMMLVSFVEFIIYITASEEAFERSYIIGKRSWF